MLGGNALGVVYLVLQEQSVMEPALDGVCVGVPVIQKALIFALVFVIMRGLGVTVLHLTPAIVVFMRETPVVALDVALD